MTLESIGFYTLSDKRAKSASYTSDLMRCELILTDACNFRCPYCRGLPEDVRGTMPLERAKSVVSQWALHNLRNIRFSGGEPAYYRGIVELVNHAKSCGIERIALSTNGSAPLSKYHELIQAGVNDLSISLDACCAADGDQLAGGISGAWETVIVNIRALAQLEYVTVGIVLTESTIEHAGDIIAFAHYLGVSDIRVIPAAQLTPELARTIKVNDGVLEAHPILRYRLANAHCGNSVRGLRPEDSSKCRLVLDDMAVAGDYHYPCIIYLREQGSPIGRFDDIEAVRRERLVWAEHHDCKADPICRNNCLDVCRDYNNVAASANSSLIQLRRKGA